MKGEKRQWRGLPCYTYIQAVAEDADPFEPADPGSHGVQVDQQTTEQLQATTTKKATQE